MIFVVVVVVVVVIEEFIHWTVPVQEGELLLLIPKQSNPILRVSIPPCGHAIFFD